MSEAARSLVFFLLVLLCFSGGPILGIVFALVHGAVTGQPTPRDAAPFVYAGWGATVVLVLVAAVVMDWLEAKQSNGEGRTDGN